MSDKQGKENGKSTSNLKVLDFNPDIENEYVEKVKSGVDKYVSNGGKIVMFDYDGTIRGNNKVAGVSSYIRRGFIDSYNYCKQQGLQIEICTLRKSEEIDNLENLGIVFDEINSSDKMLDYIAKHPNPKQTEAEEMLKKSSEELISLVNEIESEIKRGKRPEKWSVFLQAAGIHMAEKEENPNSKILFMAHRFEQGEWAFLIDDDEDSGGLAERLETGVLIPKPEGYEYDKD